MLEAWETLEFDRILQRLAEQAVSVEAKERLLALTPGVTENDCIHRMAETTEARRVLDAAGAPPLSMMEALGESLGLALAGGMLVPGQLAGVTRFAVSCRRLQAYLHRAGDVSPMIAAYGGEMRALSPLEAELEAAVDEERVLDSASPLLRNIRRKIEQQESLLKEKLTHLMKTKAAYLADNYITQRRGHWVLPVQRRYQQQFGGVVIESSGKGSTVFMEPESAARLQQETELLRMQEEEETRRVLYQLSDRVAQDAPALERNRALMTELDVLFAKAKLSADMDAREVELSPRRCMRLHAARHPLLDQAQCVPLDLILEEEYTGIIITGPNTGGKTVTMKTVGLMTLMALSGLHLPCQAGSVIPLRDGVYCDIGDRQSLNQNLSTFSGHLTQVIQVLEQASSDSLVLLDELGSGTDPAEGMGIAIAVLEELCRRGCMLLVTTHDPQVKRYAQEREGLMSARMAFDRETLRPLYRLEMGKAGESCALHIARRLGFPAPLLETARRASYQGTWGTGGTPLLPCPASTLQRRKMRRVGEIPIFTRGDSVQILPEKEKGLVYLPADDHGEVTVQVKGEKRRIPHTRIQLLVPASALYPPDYDFSIVFDTVANRKAAHTMERKYDPDAVIVHCTGEDPGKK